MKATEESFLVRDILGIPGVQSINESKYENVKEIVLSDFGSKNAVILKLMEVSSVNYIWESLKLGDLPFIPTGEILLKPKEGVSLKDVVNRLNLGNQVIVDTVLGDIVVIRAVLRENLFNVSNSIYESHLVEWCHPNFFVPMTKSSNDPLYSQQYYLNNTGQSGGIAGIDINVVDAWEISKGDNIRVAVIDDGVEDHEDLAGRLLSGFTPRDVNGNGRPLFSGAHGMDSWDNSSFSG